ncbi:MAG: mannose-1-phosphate guanylyltransferase [bacterium]|nr:mannose-1-phosphate guanylyltransferase [bacterium]
MAGGRGTRFWPLSRAALPKQLLPLATGASLLRDTYDRVAPLVGPDRILVITGAALADDVRRELPDLPAAHVIGEPVGRNTAPCAVLGAGLAGRLAPGEPVALLPADHLIPESEIFASELGAALDRAAGRETVVTLGIRPDRPETGYGYLLAGTEPDAGGFLPGEAFVEKPDRATAETYLAGGRHYWNGGIFVWNASWFAEQAAAHLPAVTDRMAPAVAAFGTDGFPAALEDAYADCPADSLDYAVMEKLAGFEVLPAGFGWSDLGSWDAWGDLAPELTGGNRGRAPLVAVDATGNVVRTDGKLVALVGVDDLVVVDTPDALLVCRKEDAQRIKAVIEHLEKDKRQDLL